MSASTEGMHKSAFKICQHIASSFRSTSVGFVLRSVYSEWCRTGTMALILGAGIGLVFVYFISFPFFIPTSILAGSLNAPIIRVTSSLFILGGVMHAAACQHKAFVEQEYEHISKLYRLEVFTERYELIRFHFFQEMLREKELTRFDIERYLNIPHEAPPLFAEPLTLALIAALAAIISGAAGIESFWGYDQLLPWLTIVLIFAFYFRSGFYPITSRAVKQHELRRFLLLFEEDGIRSTDAA